MRSRLAAEFIGTFILVFAGAGAIVIDDLTKALGHVGVAMTFGLVVMVLVYALGHISGAHLNPAVTLAFTVIGDFPLREALPYGVAQLLGASAASALLRALFGAPAHLGATLPIGAPWQSLVLEIVLTFVLMYVIMGAAVDGRAVKGFAGLAIGGAVGLDAMFGGPISGASMNPARSFGPALLAGTMQHQWVYWAGPIAGAMLAALAYRLLHGGPPDAAVSAGADDRQSAVQ